MEVIVKEDEEMPVNTTHHHDAAERAESLAQEGFFVVDEMDFT